MTKLPFASEPPTTTVRAADIVTPTWILGKHGGVAYVQDAHPSADGLSGVLETEFGDLLVQNDDMIVMADFPIDTIALDSELRDIHSVIGLLRLDGVIEQSRIPRHYLERSMSALFAPSDRDALPMPALEVVTAILRKACDARAQNLTLPASIVASIDEFIQEASAEAAVAAVNEFTAEAQAKADLPDNKIDPEFDWGRPE
jgi:hypothetical protein